MVTRVTKMMYVYFNEDMNIAGVSPVLDDNIVKQGMQYTKFNVDDVRPFITGEKNLSTHYLEPHKQDPTKFVIRSRSLEINYIKTLDRFLTEVDNSGSTVDYHMLITNCISKKELTFKLHHTVRNSMLQDDLIEIENITINGIPELDFYFTAKNDPSFLTKYVCIKTNELVGYEYVTVNYDDELSENSLFTKKIFDNYIYEVIQ